MQIDLPQDILSIIDTEHRPSLKELKEYISKGHAWLQARHRKGASGYETVRGHTILIDLLLKRLFEYAGQEAVKKHYPSSQSCAIAAIGGYGRGELNPYSDIDVLFLYPSSISSYHKSVTEQILYYLWDLGLTVGFSTRSISDCLHMARTDLTARTALMDSRIIAGDQELFGKMEMTLFRDVIWKGVDPFIREKLKENEVRHLKYGSSVYILEPNIKDGEGGLRDMHTALWVAKARYRAGSFRALMTKGVITPKDLAFLERSMEFLLRVRSELHYLSGRKNDQLTFDCQEKIAAFLRFKNTRSHLAVECFMRSYYIYARNISRFSGLLIKKASAGPGIGERVLSRIVQRDIGDGFKVFNNRITVSSATLFEEAPAKIMKAFEFSRKHGLALSDFSEELLLKGLRFIDEAFRQDSRVNESFISIITGDKRVYETLKYMHDLRVLGKYIPEFGSTFCRVQHDVYHVYTLDTHSLFTVREIRRLLEGGYSGEFPLLSEMAANIERPHVLVLAGLLHDIGKGLGRGHAERGASMSRVIASRLGLTEGEAELLEFLVRRHLQMAHVSQRRDISDERFMLDFCKTMGDAERLRMLYLLTFADMRAVGPDVWTPWKGRLLEELYRAAMNIFEKKLVTERMEEKAARRMKEVGEILKDQVAEGRLREFSRSLPARYFTSNPPEKIAAHIKMLKGIEEQSILTSIEHRRELGFSEVTVCTLNIPGLFSRITGVMAANGINILNAQIYTSSDGTVIDILTVNDPYGRLMEDNAKWLRLREELTAVIEGRKRVEDLLAKRPVSVGVRERMKSAAPPSVEIDNLVSDGYTVIDIYARDRLGLLYSITSTLTRLGLYTDIAKISTSGDQAADVFYVKDIFGHKVTEAAKLDKIKEAVMEAL